MSKENNFFAQFFNKDTQDKIMNLSSQLSSNLINCNTLNQIIDSKANLTDEYLTDQINLFKKDHSQVEILINKYLKSYEEKRSDKTIYQIRKFLKSGDCKNALEDSQVKQYLNQLFNSKEFQEQFQQILKENLHKLFS